MKKNKKEKKNFITTNCNALPDVKAAPSNTNRMIPVAIFKYLISLVFK
jgi:hypothetical protein